MQLNYCKLCGNRSELQESHIIPKFVFKYLKKSSVTGYFRLGEIPDRRPQDGYKIPLLCRRCEQMFSQWERLFASKVFIPLNKDQTLGGYGSWLLKFAVSVSWRVLSFFRNELDLNHFPEKLLISVDSALKTWKDFMFDERPHPGKYEQHFLPFSGLISGHDDPEIPTNINRYIFRSIDIDAACNKNEAFIYAKMCRTLFIGFIEIKNPNHWRDTKIHVKQGKLTKRHYRLPMELRDFIYYKARRAKNVQKKMSDKQWERIGNDYRKRIDQFPDSDMFKAMDQDAILFGESAFDYSK